MLLPAMSGRIHTYLSALKMENQWKERGTEAAKSTRTPDTDIRSVAGEETSEESQRKLERIAAKVDAGRKLTPAERKYLQEKDPDTYALLVQEEQEQRAFEKAVQSCTGKKDLERLRLWRVGRSMKTIKEIERDASLSPERKQKLMQREKRILDAANESVRTAEQSLGKKAGLPVRRDPRFDQLLVSADRKSMRLPKKTED